MQTPTVAPFSRLGKAAQIVGVRRVEQELAMALPVVLAADVDADTVSRMLRTFRTIADRSERSPPALREPSPDRRIKVRWTTEMIAVHTRENEKPTDPSLPRT